MSNTASSSSADTVKVCCRVRPLEVLAVSSSSSSSARAVAVSDDARSCAVRGETGAHAFTFDHVFGESAAQRDVHEYAGRPIVEQVMQGYNGCVCVYGQTGSGKTFTMTGPDIQDETMAGIIPRMVADVFDLIAEAPADIEFAIKASYVEIYMERVRDLLAAVADDAPSLKIREEGREGVDRRIWVEGAVECYVSSVSEVLDLMRYGQRSRHIAETRMNTESSRSHAIFMLQVTQTMADNTKKTGKMYLVDLAGSEKVKRSGATGVTLDEAMQINKSLSTLGHVINNLTDGRSTHVPYRDSKLTRLLTDALGGNSRTTLIICASPAAADEHETLSTLRFGERAKTIRNRAHVNVERSPAVLQALLEAAERETVRLRARVAELEALPSSASTLTTTPAAAAAVAREALYDIERALEEEHAHCDALRDELERAEADKETQFRVMQQLKAKVDEAASRELTLLGENELLLEQLAEKTIELEHRTREANEARRHVQRLTLAEARARRAAEDAQRDALQQQQQQQQQQQRQPSIPSSTDEDARRTFADVDETWTEKERALLKEAEENVEDEEATRASVQRETALAVAAADDDDDEQTTAARQSSRDVIEDERLQQLRERVQELEVARDALSASVERDVKAQATAETLQRLVEVRDAELEHARRQLTREQREARALRAAQARWAKDRENFAEFKRQTRSTLDEISQLKDALLRDLETRCARIAELEQVLAASRAAYDRLAASLAERTSLASAERLAEQAATIDALRAETTRAVHDKEAAETTTDVLRKQMSLRNERIRALERMLRDAQERLLRAQLANGYAASMTAAASPSAVASVLSLSSSSSSPPPPPTEGKASPRASATAARIAKPVRGGTKSLK